MNDNVENRSELPVKWLRVLMYIAIASFINSFFIPAYIATWISRGIMLAMTVCMLQLAPANERYKKAGILRAIMLGCALFTAFVFGSALLTLAASVVSMIAVYQEYQAHSELVADKDEKLSGRWRSLFTWSILAAVILSFGASIVAVIFVLVDMGDAASRISEITIMLLSIPQWVIDILYITYIRKMIAVFSFPHRDADQQDSG